MLIPYLVTYPRSGSHYFDELVYKEAKIRIQKSHSLNLLFDKDNNKTKTILTIARDPKESIISSIALGKKYYVVDNIRIDQIITEYILLYSFLYDHADYVIDFKDLVKYPELTIKKILGLLKIEKESHHLFSQNPIDYSEHYIKSSKVLPDYEEDVLDGHSLDVCYFYYNRLLEKKIIV